MTPKIMQCEYGENKGMYYCMRETGEVLNSAGPSVPIVEYLHFANDWRPTTFYFFEKEYIETLLKCEDND